ncbi:hypothetical protein HETIRDRAFT_311767 [Heterobasidion irregulare TC 32-1]|uniref:Uncharacterized protein n=1 Tax=Heterobasidion irregulare (strain TC 32-1) TaxID=747525 RepID=W4KD12_HETIT|nr:uncharacterized protein HETIRDRAFT_311767 [Heterobasidion irregulare TC 32-1]ETW83629.1 hypothetical protein HETIRDRAFT_311767 [Heterobasidion irregulare TC 32-1]
MKGDKDVALAALQRAIFGGRKAVLQLLLDRGAGVSAPGGVLGDALGMASARSYVPLVRKPLDRGAEINKPRGYTLQGACRNGNEAAVRLLLDRGAEVNAQGRMYGNALQAASRGGHETVARLLLNRGAEVNAKEGPCGNALQAASERGHEAVVRLPLDRGADVNARGVAHKSALWAALTPTYRIGGSCQMRVSSKEVMKVLWDAGARLYTMPSEAHSGECIAQLADMDSMVLIGDAEVSQPQSSRRKGWPLSLKTVRVCFLRALII